jgi:O-antigen/teichoic acid export membrane protein
LWVGYVGVVTSLAWALGYAPRLLTLVLLLSAMQGALSLDNSARAVFLGRQYAGVLGKIDIFKVLLETITTVTVLTFGYGAVMLAGARFTTAVVMIACTFLVLYRRIQVRWRAPQLGQALALLPAGLRFASVSVVQAIYDRVGFLILGHALGAHAVALVGAATIFTEKISWFLPSVQSALFPVFSRLHTTAREQLGAAFTRAFRYQTVLAVGCGLGVSAVGPWVIQCIFPAQFWPAGAIITVLGWVCAPRLLTSFCLTVLQSLGKERQVSWIALLQCTVYFSAALFFISQWGLIGFAWAYVIAETTAVTLQLAVLARAGLLTEAHLGSMLLTLGAGLAVFGAALLVPESHHSVVVRLGVLLCYPLLLLLMRRISVEDVRYLQGLWTRETPATV